MEHRICSILDESSLLVVMPVLPGFDAYMNPLCSYSNTSAGVIFGRFSWYNAPVRMILHIYSYLFHLALALFLAGIAAVAKITDAPNFDLEMLPGSDTRLVNYLFWVNLAGIASVILAFTGKLRWLYPVYGVAVFVLAVRGFFFSSYAYDGMDPFKQVLWFTGGALLAMLGSLSQLRRRKRW
jgi:hypothetical protein